MSNVLVVNIGSTSLKFRLFEMPSEACFASGRITDIGGAPSGEFRFRDETVVDPCPAIPDQASVIAYLIGALGSHPARPISGWDDVAAVGFKVVGGERQVGATLLDDSALAAMETFVPLLPRHNPPYIDAIRTFARLLPGTPLVGLFENTFHRHIPPEAYTYGIPLEWQERYGARRYGYHGASFTWIASRMPEIMGRPADELRYVACHLGGSSSVCAIKGGVSVDTSMGMSAQAGLPQSSRSGDVDPFLVLYLMDRERLSTDEMRAILASQGGLAGISGSSGAIEVLEAAAARGDRRAALAVDVFVHEVRGYVGAYAAELGGLDALVFSGGIGEKGAAIRRRICEGLGFLGLELNDSRNLAISTESIISTDGSRAKIVVIPANEEIVVARAVHEFVTAAERAAQAGGAAGIAAGEV